VKRYVIPCVAPVVAAVRSRRGAFVNLAPLLKKVFPKARHCVGVFLF